MVFSGCSSCTTTVCRLTVYLRFYHRSGIGAGMDIVVSSVKAYIGALNKMLGFQGIDIKVTEEKTLSA